ncbi:MAG TPA: glycosyltransferase [Segetibacter sp.]|jgi:glycosyltransferase involved in cell wall biosynthesis
MKIRIVHITQALGGVKTYFAQILTHIDLSRFEIILIAPSDNELKELCSANHITYYQLNIKRQIHLFYDPYCFVQILSFIRKIQPNIIHAHSAKGGMLGKLSAYFHRIPVVFTPNAFSYLSFIGFKRTLFYSLEFFSRKKVNKLLAVSYSESDRAVHELNYKAEQVSVVLNFIKIDTAAVNRNFDQCKQIGMIGRLTHQKNPLFFLEIAKRIQGIFPEIKFILLGAGYHDHLKKDALEFIRNHQLNNVQIVSWGEYQLEKFYEELDIFLLTSSFEGLPFSLLEAMSYKLPCIATNVDGSKDVVKHNDNGFLVNSAEETVSKIVLLIQSKALRERLGSSAYEYVKEFHNAQINVKKIELLYENLLD